MERSGYHSSAKTKDWPPRTSTDRRQHANQTGSRTPTYGGRCRDPQPGGGRSGDPGAQPHSVPVIRPAAGSCWLTPGNWLLLAAHPDAGLW